MHIKFIDLFHFPYLKKITPPCLTPIASQALITNFFNRIVINFVSITNVVATAAESDQPCSTHAQLSWSASCAGKHHGPILKVTATFEMC